MTAYPFPEASTSGFQKRSSTFLPLDDFSNSFCRKSKLVWDLRLRSEKDIDFWIKLDLVYVLGLTLSTVLPNEVIIAGGGVGVNPVVPHHFQNES